MAFIDFTSGATATSPQAGIVHRTGAVVKLSELEKAAADIGAHDPLSSIRDESRLMGWIRSLFAIPRTAALADPKLEAIRRLAVVAHLGVDIALTHEERRARASGVAFGQMAAVLARFGRPMASVPSARNGWRGSATA
jgi:hypothetical protein